MSTAPDGTSQRGREGPSLGQLARHWEPWARPAERWTIVPHRSSPAAVRDDQKLCGVRVPAELTALAQSIRQSRWMLELEPDWDGQGSPPYSSDTWDRAATLLLTGAVDYLGHHHQTIPIPAFDNGPEGSIDIFWDFPDGQVLLNVPAELDSPVRYYGHSSLGFEIRGTESLARQQKWFPCCSTGFWNDGEFAGRRGSGRRSPVHAGPRERLATEWHPETRRLQESTA